MIRTTITVLLLLVALVAPASAASPEFGTILVQAKQGVLHATQSAVADDGSATTISADEWNAAHTAPPMTLHVLGGAGTAVWTSQPASLTEFLGVTYYRTKVDLTNVTQVQLVVPVAVVGGASAEIRVQYTTDLTGASGWAYLDGATGPAVTIASTGVRASGWVTVTAAAQAAVLIRVIGING